MLYLNYLNEIKKNLRIEKEIKMNKQIEKRIENKISEFSGIEYKLYDYTLIYSNKHWTDGKEKLTLINVNVNYIKEEYELDVETFEVLDRVE